MLTLSYPLTDFKARNGTHIVSAVTKDHVCSSRNEMKIVSALSKDPKPFRASHNDNSLAFQRVAGSLAITRAMGDGYLKHPELSFDPYLQYIPYITCRPTIKYRKLRQNDKYLILASDGLFNFITADDILNVLDETTWVNKRVQAASGESETVYHSEVLQQRCMEDEVVQKGDSLKRARDDAVDRQIQTGKLIRTSSIRNATNSQIYSNKESTFADILVDRTLSKAARRHDSSMTVADLRKLPQGKSRREIVDDITVITVDISSYIASLNI